MNRKQLIAALESRRVWLAVLAVVEAINQAAGLHVPANVFAAIEGAIGLLLTGDTVVSAVHAGNLNQPTEPSQTTTMGANAATTVAK